MYKLDWIYIGKQEILCELRQLHKVNRVSLLLSSATVPIRICQFFIIQILNYIHFLDASVHLYERVCLSIRQSVCPSVPAPVYPSLHPSVRNTFSKNPQKRVLTADIDKMKKGIS